MAAVLNYGRFERLLSRYDPALTAQAERIAVARNAIRPDPDPARRDWSAEDVLWVALRCGLDAMESRWRPS